MAHFMQAHPGSAFHLDSPRICVTAKRVGNRLVIVPDSIGILRADTPLFWLDEKFEVVSEDGQPVKPTGRFAVTAQTIDPYHVVTDIF